MKQIELIFEVSIHHWQKKYFEVPFVSCVHHTRPPLPTTHRYFIFLGSLWPPLGSYGNVAVHVYGVSRRSSKRWEETIGTRGAVGDIFSLESNEHDASAQSFLRSADSTGLS